ncbi:DciA family protein [Stackebrandtia soli]|uniref:DciA family protein n=1 Tax=Stackebrandtia soli TaxID=1892856 RepID=UPI0039E959D5
MSYEYKPRRRKRRGGGQWSGPGPDARDPQTLKSLLAKMVSDRGWNTQAAGASLFARWNEIIGPEIADHCRPMGCRDGELSIEAESAAWATQLRLFKPQILAKITAGVGPGIVSRVKITGPVQTSHVTGPRRVRYTPKRDSHG